MKIPGVVGILAPFVTEFYAYCTSLIILTSLLSDRIEILG
jgi:hypothetical protein